MTIHSAQRIYFSGIGGIGMSGLARLLHADGKTIYGSDMQATHITDALQRLGIAVSLQQHHPERLATADIMIASDAVPPENAERKIAAQHRIPVFSYFGAVGEYMTAFRYRLAVSGTHGKTTTTAMLGNMLVHAGKNPTVIVGSIVREWGASARSGAKDLFLVEACEHKAHMLHLHPDMIIITNIEEDHLDYYRDLDHIVMTFQKYINHLPSNGVFIKNADDTESRDLGYDGKIITYGLAHRAHVKARQHRRVGMTQYFLCDDTLYTLRIPGKFNCANALAAIAAGRTLGIPESIMQKTLDHFRGVWRRFEVLGEYREATIISDYAHHPTAIMETIAAAHQFYPKRRLVVIFQPHQRSRTRALFEKFTHAFSKADLVIIQEIYEVAGRERPEDAAISSRDLVAAIEEQGKYALYTENSDRTRAALDEMLEPGDVVLVMGAGDIYLLAEQLIPQQRS